LVDLHSHTSESDGTYSPADLIALAAATGVRSLAVTDHDTFTGFDRARPCALQAGIELICGIELSTKLNGQSVHLLGYFFSEEPPSVLRKWVEEMQASRRDRNVRLAERLRELGFDISLEEAEARGRGMTGRPHFAAIMLERGYVSSYREAFDKYLDESAIAYVYRREPQLGEAVAKIRDAGGVASLAHPIRVSGDLPSFMPELRSAGLNAIEAYHSDHNEEQTAFYLEMAARYGMAVSGGSDFHGDVKPEVKLGTGCDGNLHVPCEVVDRLRQAVRT